VGEQLNAKAAPI